MTYKLDPEWTTGTPLQIQIRCVERCLAQRERRYPGLVSAGKIDKGVALYEIDTMRAVLATLKKIRL